jgi:hypothetical protein
VLADGQPEDVFLVGELEPVAGEPLAEKELSKGLRMRTWRCCARE